MRYIICFYNIYILIFVSSFFSVLVIPWWEIYILLVFLIMEEKAPITQFNIPTVFPSMSLYQIKSNYWSFLRSKHKFYTTFETTSKVLVQNVYFQFGFKRQKSTGEVNLDKVYRGGKSWFGPDYDFLVYRADAHFLDLVKIDIFTRDKLEVRYTSSFTARSLIFILIIPHTIS